MTMFSKSILPLLRIAKYYGVFYIQDKSDKNQMFSSYSIAISLVFTVCHAALFLLKRQSLEEAGFTIAFMDYVTATILLTINCLIWFYSFNTPTNFKYFLQLMDETQNIISKIYYDSTKRTRPSIIVNYLLFLVLVGFFMILSMKHYNYQTILHSVMELIFLFILFHSMVIALYSLQHIQQLYLEITTICQKILLGHFALPPEEAVEIADGIFLISGWTKSVLERRNSETIIPIVIVMTTAIDNLNTAVDIMYKIHRFPILICLITIATLYLDLLNTILILYKDNQLLEMLMISVKTLLSIPLLVSWFF